MNMTVTPVFDDIDLEIILDSLRCYVDKMAITSLITSTEKVRARDALSLLERVEELLDSEDINIIER